MLVASGAEKELSRVKKIMGLSWVNQVNGLVSHSSSGELNTRVNIGEGSLFATRPE